MIARFFPPTVWNNQDSTENLFVMEESALDDVRPALNVIVAREAWRGFWAEVVKGQNYGDTFGGWKI